MVIVSQDRTEIFNFNEIFRLYIDNWSNEEFATEPNCFCIKAEKASDNMICAFLGEYATKERAKEVLKEIIREYRHITIGYTGMKNYNPINNIDRPVYEMPLE